MRSEKKIDQQTALFLLGVFYLMFDAAHANAQLKTLDENTNHYNDVGAVIPHIKRADTQWSDTVEQAINRRYYILQHNNDGTVFGLGNTINLEVVYPVHQSLPETSRCKWSFDKEIAHLQIRYDKHDSCYLTLHYPYKPQPISSQFSYQVKVRVTSNDGEVSQPITRTLAFKNHLYASLAVNSATLSRAKPITFNVFAKNKDKPFPREISCATNLIEKPFKIVSTSTNGCSGTVVLTPEHRLSSVARKSLQKSSHRVGIIIKYDGLNVGRQVINFSIDT